MTLLLEIDGLTVRYATRRGALTAVDNVSLSLAAGETLGLVGESGCGKSSLGKAVVRLVTPAAGAIRLDGVDLVPLGHGALKPHRRRVQMVFQDPLGALDPRQTIAGSLAEPLMVHGVPAAERRRRVADLLSQVGLHPDMAARLPHEFSGGQRQRIGIARALALQPDLIVCDEPVSALDLSLQAQVLNLLRDFQQRLGIAYLFISHDLSVVDHMADRVAVMYLGRIVEIAPRGQIWRRAAHPYTQALISAVPVADPGHGRILDRPTLHGDLPSPFAVPQGCRFQARCPHVQAICRTLEPPLIAVAPGQLAACHLHGTGTAVAAPSPAVAALA